MTALLNVTNLSVGFRQDGHLTQAVRGVSFAVHRGETVALVGESGSGKSVSALSTVSLLGDSAEVSGSVTYDGQEMIGANERLLRKVRGNDISFIFQEPMTSLNPLHTIEKQLAESLALHQGIAGTQARARILELLDKVGIRDAETAKGVGIGADAVVIGSKIIQIAEQASKQEVGPAVGAFLKDIRNALDTLPPL